VRDVRDVLGSGRRRAESCSCRRHRYTAIWHSCHGLLLGHGVALWACLVLAQRVSSKPGEVLAILVPASCRETVVL
jgi:hypothetical protein